MTQSALKEGERLNDLIADYRRTLETFKKMEEKNLQKDIAEFLTGMRMIPNKKEMAQVMRNAVIESCNLCISQAQEKFDSL